MKKLIILLLALTLSSCAALKPEAKKHSYETKEGRKKLKNYNDLYNGGIKKRENDLKNAKQAIKNNKKKPTHKKIR